MRTTVLYRRDRLDPDQDVEVAAITPLFPCTELRTSPFCEQSLIIGRYSVLPFYRELERDLAGIGSRLINSFGQHDWVGSFAYYAEVADYTFPSWNSLAETRSDGPFVIKGRTNSRKHQWSTHMFAENRAAAVRVIHELNNDSLIGRQGTIVRQYIPLKTLEVGIGGIPFSNEHRFFFLGTHLLSHGYYWSLADRPELAVCSPEMVGFAREVAAIAAEFVNFFVLDVAEKEDGGFILVEINDGSCSGLSLNDPRQLWGNMHVVLNEDGAMMDRLDL